MDNIEHGPFHREDINTINIVEEFQENGARHFLGKFRNEWECLKILKYLT